MRLLALLLFPLLAFATTTVIPGANTTRVIDNRLIGIATATSDTFLNKGGGVDALIGFEGTSGEEYGRYILGVNFDTIPSGDVIDSVVIRLYNGLAAGVPVEVICARNHSAWKEGTADGTYQQYSSSWHCQGAGTMFDGSTVANADTEWVETGFGGGVPVKTDCPTTEVSTAGYYYWRPTDHVADSFAVTNYITFLFYDTLFQTGASHERCRFATTEAAVDSQRPQITVYHHTPVDEDSTWLRISVAPPSSPLSNYPVLVNFLTYPDIASQAITFYASDSTTKLYWWPDSMSGHYTRVWVIHDWSSNPDTIFVRRIGSASYKNADSVFIIHDTFSESFSLSQTIADWDNYSGVTFDTNGVMLSNTTNGIDSTIREPSGMIYDWQETDSDLRWKFFYCAERTDLPGEGVANRYDNNFLMWASAPTYTGTWTKEDTVMYDSSGVTQALNAEDPDIVWLPEIDKWGMYVEDHDSSEIYRVSVMLADSLDQAVWEKYRITSLDAQAIGTPANWLDKEQASPTLTWNQTRDTLLMFFEAFGSNGNSYLGMAVSFSNGSGDTVGLDWYLTDSTGALNAEDPTPIVPWLQTGQADSAKAIPDGAGYLNDELAVFGHGLGTVYWWKGDSPRNLVYQGTDDSTHLYEVVVFDTASGDFLSTYTEDVSDDVIRARLRDFDSTRWANIGWDVHHRANRSISTNRWQCSETFQSNGVLTMYPPQRQTASVSIQSDTSFNTGCAIDIWMQCTSWSGGEAMAVISIGDTTLQDASGSQVPNSAWYNPQVKTGYSLRIHPTDTRFYRNNSGAATTGLGTAVAVGEDTIKSMRHWQILYTTGDSLISYVSGLRKAHAKDVTYNGATNWITISQGERGELDRGGVMRIDSIRVRNYTTANATATAVDTLYATRNSSIITADSKQSGTKSRTSWKSLWR